MNISDEQRKELAKALEQVAKALEQFPKDLAANLANVEVTLVPNQDQIPEQDAERIETGISGGYQSAPFDSEGYVREHCGSYIYGVTSDSDIAAIEGDSSLSYEQKQEAKAQLDYLSGMYY